MSWLPPATNTTPIPLADVMICPSAPDNNLFQIHPRNGDTVSTEDNAALPSLSVPSASLFQKDVFLSISSPQDGINKTGEEVIAIKWGEIQAALISMTIEGLCSKAENHCPSVPLSKCSRCIRDSTHHCVCVCVCVNVSFYPIPTHTEKPLIYRCSTVMTSRGNGSRTLNSNH